MLVTTTLEKKLFGINWMNLDDLQDNRVFPSAQHLHYRLGNPLDREVPSVLDHLSGLCRLSFHPTLEDREVHADPEDLIL